MSTTAPPSSNGGNYRAHLDIQSGLRRDARLWSAMDSIGDHLGLFDFERGFLAALDNNLRGLLALN